MLQPFRPLLLSWTQRGELGTLTGADQVASPPPLAGEHLFCGLYVNELLIRFLRRSDPHPGLFSQYQELLARLSGAEEPQPLLRLFEKHLLQSLGFGLQLDHEQGSGEGISAEDWYEYQPDSGPVRRDRTVENREKCISGTALLALKSGDIEDQHLRELKMLMRKLIRYHLGDRPLASHNLFKE
jgi:DNA repair protein RecO (recombination protein O)